MSIKEKRETQGLTQAEVASHVGVGQSAVAMWETGETLPRASNLIALAKLFGCTMDELLREE